MVKPILQLYPMIPAESEAEREALRPIGRNVDRYHEVLHGMTELVKAADELGFWGVSTIEHHFHSEGYEVGPAPSVYNAYWASMVRNVHVGSIGYTMSAQSPLRVAEETAILNHMMRGKSFVGFSRGYQRRWTSVLGQHLGTKATMSPNGRTAEQLASMSDELIAQQKLDDQINREIFEEHVDLVMQAWTQDSVSHNSPRWQIPNPYGEGIEWELGEITGRLGAPGELGENGKVQRISVTPAPYTQPHPPIFVASNASVETVDYAGARGFIPTYFAPVERAAKFGDSYVEAAQGGGRDFAFGENQALVRWMQIADTEEQARRAVVDYDLEIHRNLYMPLAPHSKIDENDPVQSMIDTGLFLAGTPDQVRDQFVNQWKQLPAEYCVLISHYGQQPLDSCIKNMEMFMEHVKPALDELTEYENVGAVT